jgi:hypothetical protein
MEEAGEEEHVQLNTLPGVRFVVVGGGEAPETSLNKKM